MPNGASPSKKGLFFSGFIICCVCGKQLRPANCSFFCCFLLLLPLKQFIQPILDSQQPAHKRDKTNPYIMHSHMLYCFMACGCRCRCAAGLKCFRQSEYFWQVRGLYCCA